MAQLKENANVTAIMSGVTLALDRPLFPTEYRALTKKINDLQLDQMIQTHGKKRVIDAVVNRLTAELRSLKRDEHLDIKEMQIAQLGNEPETSLMEKKVSTGTSLDDLIQTPRVIQSIFNPQALRRKAYLILDRKHQDQRGNNVTEFSWNISNTSSPYDPLTTAVTTAPLRDIVKIRVFPFRFPNTYRAISSMHRLSVELVELNTQAYVMAADNRRCHFVFDIEPTGGADDPYELIDIGNAEAIFEFHDPIIELSHLTLRFGNPNKLMSLDADSLYGTISAAGAQTLITFTLPHFTTTDGSVTITGFTTDQPAADRVEIALLNSTFGWETVAVTLLSITIDVDISGLVGVIQAPTYVYLESKRFIARLELEYIANN